MYDGYDRRKIMDTDKGFGAIIRPQDFIEDAAEKVMAKFSEAKNEEIMEAYRYFCMDNDFRIGTSESMRAFADNYEDDFGENDTLGGLIALYLNKVVLHSECNGGDYFSFDDDCLYVSSVIPETREGMTYVLSQFEIKEIFESYVNEFLEHPAEVQWVFPETC